MELGAIGRTHQVGLAVTIAVGDADQPPAEEICPRAAGRDGAPRLVIWEEDKDRAEQRDQADSQG